LRRVLPALFVQDQNPGVGFSNVQDRQHRDYDAF
jgi:hypothetical protein